jgi:hypothetical protein
MEKDLTPKANSSSASQEIPIILCIQKDHYQHSDRALKGVCYFLSLNTGFVGSNPTWGTNICFYFSVFCYPMYVEALRRADFLLKELYQLLINKILKSVQQDVLDRNDCATQKE